MLKAKGCSFEQLELGFQREQANNAFSKNISSAPGVRHRLVRLHIHLPLTMTDDRGSGPDGSGESTALCLQPLNRLQGVQHEKPAAGFEALEKFKWQSSLKDDRGGLSSYFVNQEVPR